MSEQTDPSALRRARIQQAFAEAIDTPTLARASVIARLRTEDASLADEVESLLKYHGAAAPDAEWLAQPVVARVIGTAIGGCTIERLIGFGGMSMVYAATEDFPRRKVAVKLVRPERLSPSAQRRLRVEAEALARLEHPNIARVFAAGVHRMPQRDGAADTGDSPYLVMELIPDAQPVTRFAHERKLGLRDRILLAACIADAVEHAHRAGVIHRDIKPGNVLVGADGVPKIIDFGIAAVSDSTVTAATEGPMGTLAYMSPEQARGRDTDTRSDVWGLGALLHDLLAGRPPFDAPEGSLAEHLERLLQGRLAPIAPLVGLHLGESARQETPAATDAVLRMALAPDPANRYRSAAEFAEELRNLLDGLPLRARADSPFDSLLRAVRRHRRTIAISAGFVAVVATALVAVSVALARTKAANERAEWSSYVASISAASGLLDQGDGSAAWSMLESAPPEHRGWEWNALARRSDPAIKRLELGWQPMEGGADPRGRLNQIYDIAYSLDGSTVFVAATAYLAAIDAKSLEDRWRTEHPKEFVAWRHRPVASGGSIAVSYNSQLLRLDPKGAVLSERPLAAIGYVATDGAQRRVFFGAGSALEEIDVDSLAATRTFEIEPPFAREIAAIASSADGLLLAAGDAAGTIVILETSTGRIRWRIDPSVNRAEIRSMQFTREGDRLAVCGGGFTAMFDAATGHELWRERFGVRGPRALALAPDDRTLLVGFLDESIDRLDASTGKRVAVVHGAHSQVWSLASAPDGEGFVAGSFNANLSLFAHDAQAEIRALRLDGTPVRGVSCGRRTVAVTEGGGLFEIDGPVARRIALDARATAVHEAQDGTLLVGLDSGVAWLAADDREIRRATTPAPVERIGAIDGARLTLARLHDGAHVAIETATGTPKWSQRDMQVHTGVAIETAVRDRLLLPKGWPGTTTLVNLETGKESQPTLTNEIPVIGALSPDRRTIALGTMQADGEIGLLDSMTLETRARFSNHRRLVHSLAWSPDGLRIASASIDGTVRIWHVERGIEILTAWRGDCNAVAFDDRGRLWLACADGFLRVIDGSPKETLTASRLPLSAARLPLSAALRPLSAALRPLSAALRP